MRFAPPIVFLSLLFTPLITLAQVPRIEFQSITDAAKSNRITSPQANPEPKPVENLRSFDSTSLTIQKLGDQFVLTGGKHILKNFGTQEGDALEALKILKELKVNAHGTVPGILPEFEYWLVDGKAPKRSFTPKEYSTFNVKHLKLQKILGAWGVLDPNQLIFVSTTDEAAARNAYAICRQYGFNTMAHSGEGSIKLTYFLQDPYLVMPNTEERTATPLAILSKLDQIGLILPDIGFAGPKTALDYRKITYSQRGKEWLLRHGELVIASFGKEERMARSAYQFCQDEQVNLLCLVGTSKFPLLLHDGQPLQKLPLGVTRQRFAPQQLQVKAQGKNWVILDGYRVVMNLGNDREEADRMLKLLQHYGIDEIGTFGSASSNSLRILIRNH